MTETIYQDDVLSIIFESTHTMIAYLDRDLRFVKVNRAYALADNKSPDEFIGKKHFDLYPNEKNEKIFKSVIETGVAYNSFAKPFEYQRNPERGTTYWDWSLIPARDELGNICGAVLQLLDVTERIRAEEELRIEQDFGNAVLAAANALVVVLDRDGRILRFNHACQNLTGYEFEEIRNKYVWDFLLTEEEVEPVRQIFASLTKDALPNIFTNYWVTKDGTKALINWNNSVITDPDGVASYVVSIGTDVTENQRILSKLEHDEATFKQAQAIAHIGTWDWDIQSNRLLWSDEIFRIFGVNEKDFRSTYEHFLEFVHEEDRPAVEQAVDASHSNPRTPYEIEHRIVRPTGEVRHVKETGKVYFDDSGKPVRMVGIVQDDTRALKTLEQTRLQAQIIDQIKSAVVSTDLDGFITSWNKGAERLFGYSAGEMLGQPVSMVYPPDQQVFLQQQVIATLKEKGQHETEVIMQRKNGQRFYGYLSLSMLLDSNARAIGMIGYSVDITDRVEAKRKLTESDQFNSEIISGLPIGVVIYNESGQCIKVNEVAAECLGGTREQILSQNYHNIQSWKDSGLFEYALDTVKSNETKRREISFQTSFGKEVTLEVWFAPIVIGSKRYLMGMLKDISERKRTENRIRNQAQILDQIHDSVITTDLEGFVASWNKGAERIFGYTAEEALGKHISFIYPDSELEKLEKSIIGELNRKGSHETESLMRRKNGEEFTGHLSLSFLTDEQGQRIRMIGSTMDISGRKKIEQDLIRKEQTLSDAQAIAHVGNWDWNISDGSIEWSDEIYRIFGYDPGSFEPTYEAFLVCIHEEDRQKVVDAVNASLEDPTKIYHIEHRIVTPRNEIRVVQEDGRIYLGKNGKPVRMVGTVKDITELKQAYKELEKSRARFQTMFESISDAVILVNTNREIEVVNRAALNIFGYSEKELLGNTTEMLYANKSDFNKTGNDRYNKDVPLNQASYDILYRRKDGTVFCGETLGSKIMSAGGDLTGFVGIIRDVTERRLAEDELRQFKTTLDQTSDCVFIFDPDSLVFTYVNQGAMEQVGYSWTEMENMTPVDIKPDFNEANFRDLVSPLTGYPGTSIRFETRHRHKDGHDIPVDIFLQYIAPSGEQPRFVAVVRDITERRRHEQELENYREHLEELVQERTRELVTAQDELIRKGRLATLGQLTATVSHELRNPLGAMRPSLYILQKSVDNHDEKIKQAVDRLDRNITRCDHIIDELLDYTRITVLKKSDIVVDEWIRQLLDEQILPAGVELVLDLKLGETRASVDTNRMRRALINIIENGVQAMQDEGASTTNIENAVLTVFSRDHGDRIEIGVRDTGSGIGEEILPYIFEPLYSTKGFGVGLGMPTVKQIVEQHGGEIDIETGKDKGTTVRFLLPQVSTAGEKDSRL